MLNTDEVRRVKRPHQIITSRDHPAMMYAPDLSRWMFNKMLGLGDMEHNRRLREEREQKRSIITDTKQEIALWNIWIYYQKDIMRRLSQQKGATHILLENVPGLAPTSLLLLEQLRTIDRKRLRGYIGRISKEKMLEVDAALAISIGIGYPNERRTHNV